MSVAPIPADLKQDAEGLVLMERELTQLLIEHDELRTAWPKGGHVLVRARIGRQVADALSRIADLEHAIATTPARTPAEARGTAEALSGAIGGWDDPLQHLLASALTAVEAVGPTADRKLTPTSVTYPSPKPYARTATERGSRPALHRAPLPANSLLFAVARIAVKAADLMGYSPCPLSTEFSLS